jgi:hypothetical protein
MQGLATVATADCREGQFQVVRLEVIKRGVGGDASCPPFKASCGVEAGVRAIDAPEGFEGKVLGDPRIADDANDPAVDLVLMQTEKSLEGVEAPRQNCCKTSDGYSNTCTCSAFYISLRHERAGGYIKLSPGLSAKKQDLVPTLGRASFGMN